MTTKYRHLDVTACASPKQPGMLSGDVWTVCRDAQATTVILADGLGSGVKANIAATMTCSRLQELLRQGFTARQAFMRVAETMHRARGVDDPYAVFSLLRMLNDGETTILSYEMPAPLLINGKHANLLPQRVEALEQESVAESTCYLDPEDSVIMVSDGISMAGLGAGLKFGWTMEGVKRYIDHELQHRRRSDLVNAVHNEARRLWQKVHGDDCTVVQASCRTGKMLTVISGPPSDPSLDAEVLKKFRAAQGKRVIAGATTAKMVAACMGKRVTIEADQNSLIAPPRYSIEGIELVTEGAVTLNQVYNILEASDDRLEERSGVSELRQLLLEADRIDFLIGAAANPAHGDIAFQQRGLLPRTCIVPLLAEKLRALGKLVLINVY